MDFFPYPPILTACFALVLVLCFIVTGFYAWLDWTSHPSVVEPVPARNTTASTVTDQPVAERHDETYVPIVAPGHLVEQITEQAAPMPRPPVPAPAARAFDPASHEQALTEALFVAAQADSDPGVTRLLPVQPVFVDSEYAPDTETHVQQALAAGHSYDGYVGAHRASMA